MADARIDLGYLKKKLHTLDRTALIRLREMLKDPYKVKGIKDARDDVSKEISEGWEEVREQIKGHPIREDTKEKLKSRTTFFELMHLDRVDIAAERNIKEILKEIDEILSQITFKRSIDLYVAYRERRKMDLSLSDFKDEGLYLIFPDLRPIGGKGVVFPLYRN